MTLSELQDMAARQQHQIESQQQILVAKEQRLKYLKQQEQKQQQLASENDRLRKLRDKVEAQEMKLKKLRALRGQVEQHKANNGNLSELILLPLSADKRCKQCQAWSGSKLFDTLMVKEFLKTLILQKISRQQKIQEK